MRNATIQAHDRLGEVMRRHPATIRVLLAHRMACPGCPMAPFMTVAEAARAHGVEVDALLDRFGRAAGATARPGGPA